ncbi:MAG: type IV pilus assembly protein PilM [Candidatus Omnitrophota bacterium]
MVNNNHRFIGIDIGASSIKFAELKSVRGALQLKEAFASEFQFDSSTLKTIQTQEAIRELVSSALKKINRKTQKVCISIWGQSAFVRFIKLPKVENKKLIKMIGFEAQQQVPFPIEEVIWDYQLFPNPHSPELDVLLVAIKNKAVNFLLESLQQTKIEIEYVDVNPLACLNAVNFLYRNESLIIVDIGAKATNIIIQDGNKVWTRSISLGGSDITKSIMVHYNLDFKKAEELKKKDAKALLSEVGKVIDGSEHTREMISVISPILASIASEISNSIGFYKSQFGLSKQINKVLITGGSSCITNLDKFFEYNLGIPTERVDLSKNGTLLISGSKEIAQTQIYTAAVGLALRGFKNKSRITINLLPPEEKVLKSFKDNMPKFVSYMTVGIVGILLAGVLFFNLDKKRVADFKELNAKNEDINNYNSQIKQLNANAIMLKEKTDTLLMLKANRYFWPDILAAVATIIPKELWLTDLKRDASTIIIEGKAEGSFMQISDFRDKLEDSKIFKNVEILSANFEKQKTKQDAGQEVRIFVIKMMLE